MLYGYLFYTHDNKGYCRSLITLLERHGLNKVFEYKLIDNMSEEQLMRLQIEDVPALLVISGTGQNKQQQIYEGDKAFTWVENFLIGRRQMAMRDAEKSRRLIQNNNTKERLTEKLYEYCPGEHAGISDAYAYYNEDESKDINMPQGKMFNHDLNYQNDNVGAIPIRGKMSDYKKKEGLNAVYGNDMKKILGNMEDERKKQDEQLKNIMELDTIRTVINKM